MAETTHHGGCHCGAVRYHVDLDLEAGGITCNCSMCARAGTILAFVPAAKFALERGDSALASYRFHKQHIDHLFCSTCGIKAFARGTGRDGTAMIAVNLRCLDDVEVAELTTRPFDGKAL